MVGDAGASPTCLSNLTDLAEALKMSYLGLRAILNRAEHMIRILLSLAVAAAAFFGPWFVETTQGSITGPREAVVLGDVFAGDTVACALSGTVSLSGPCAPQGGLMGTVVTAAVVLGVASAALNVLGLLPVVGRVTSLLAIAAGAAGVAALGVVSTTVMGEAGLSALRWGAYATGGFGLLLVLAGLSGLRGDERD